MILYGYSKRDNRYERNTGSFGGLSKFGRILGIESQVVGGKTRMNKKNRSMIILSNTIVDFLQLEKPPITISWTTLHESDSIIQSTL